MLKLYDKTHTFAGRITQYRGCKIDIVTATGEKTLSFTLLEDINIQTEFYIRDGTDEYVVKEIDLDTDTNPVVFAALNLEELEGKAWNSFQVADSTISAAASLAIAGTGWTVGATDVTKKRNAGIVKKSALGVINDLATAWMCEVGYDTIQKKIYFYTKKGSDKGVYFLTGLNLKKLTKRISAYDYYTRIIPYGADGLDITSVNSGVEYIDNFQYSNKVKTYIWEDTNYDDAAKLKEDAIAKLADMSKPEISYQASIMDLAAMSDTYSLMEYAPGDTVTLIDKETGTKEKQRIVKMTVYPDDPESNTCELSNVFLSWEEMQAKLQASAAIVDAMIGSDGNYNGTIKVSDILHFSDGVIGTSGGSNVTLGGFYQTTSGKLGALELEVGNLQTNKLSADEAAITYATITNLNAATGRISTLEANSVTVQYADLHYATIDNLTAATGRITTLETNSLTAADAALTYATIQNLNAATGRITTLETNSLTAADAAITYATITNLDSAVARIGALEANSITAAYADLHYANIGLSNVQTESVKDLLVNTGVIKNATISQGHITGVLDAVTVNASDIVAGTLSVDRLLIRGSTSGIVYQLNNLGQITSQEVDTIDGYVLTPRTITADRIVAGAITANEIAAGTITANEIASNTITGAQITGTTLSGIFANLGTITAGVLKSSDYSYTSGNYSAAGMMIDLNSKIYRTPKTAILADGSIYTTSINAVGGKVGGFTITSTELQTSTTFGSVTYSAIIQSGDGAGSSGDPLIKITSTQGSVTNTTFAVSYDGEVYGRVFCIPDPSNDIYWYARTVSDTIYTRIETNIAGRGLGLNANDKAHVSVASTASGTGSCILQAYDANDNPYGFLINPTDGVICNGALHGQDSLFSGGRTSYADGNTGVAVHSNGSVYASGGLLSGGRTAATDGGTGVVLGSNGYVYASGGIMSGGRTSTTDNVAGIILHTNGNIYTSGGIFTGGRTAANDGVPGFYANSTGNLYLVGNTSAGSNIYFYYNKATANTASISETASGVLTVSAPSGFKVPNVYNATGSYAANVFVQSDGRMLRSTSSSKRYKHDIKVLRDYKKVLGIPVVSFVYNNGYLDSADQRYMKDVPGFIAEDVAEHYPIAADWVDGRIEDWNARYIIPPMLAVEQDHERRIRKLEEAIR